MNDENDGIRLLEDVDHWRSRAKETREIAHTMDGELRAAMVVIELVALTLVLVVLLALPHLES